MDPSNVLTIEDPTNVWFTSDIHFGHANIIKYCDRPYADADEMNGKLIDSFNAVLDEDSILINMGDVTMNHRYLWAMRQLKGTHVLVPGNHDAIWPAHKKFKEASVWDEYARTFYAIVPIHTNLFLAGQQFLMSHMPYDADPHEHGKHEAFRPKDQGLPLICGHVHGAWRQVGTQFNVGVDMNDFKPVPASAVLEWRESLG